MRHALLAVVLLQPFEEAFRDDDAAFARLHRVPESAVFQQRVVAAVDRFQLVGVVRRATGPARDQPPFGALQFELGLLGGHAIDGALAARCVVGMFRALGFGFTVFAILAALGIPVPKSIVAGFRAVDQAVLPGSEVVALPELLVVVERGCVRRHVLVREAAAHFRWAQVKDIATTHPGREERISLEEVRMALHHSNCHDNEMRTMHDLTNKVVLLTGIGAVGHGWGNGTTLAALFARQGATVFGCDINLEAAKRAAREICEDSEVCARSGGQQKGNAVEIFEQSTDVTKSDQVSAFVTACCEKYGRIDILVNNVGKSEPGGPAELSEETWDAQTNVNLKSIYLTCHIVLPIMEKQEQGGCVLNISSVAGLRYIGKDQVAYAAMKAAIIQFTKTTSVIYAQRTGGKVRLNTVIPGLINTPLVKVLADKYAGGDYEGFQKTRDAQVPVGRMGTAWDVAHAGLFLCSDEARYITGAEIVVDGGITNSTGRT
nr:3-oxoacyl-[acyl-carrier-protein] reductase fabg [Quercus suber]